MDTANTQDFRPQKGLSAEQIEDLITDILGAATLEEKVAMMSGQGFFDSMKRTGMRWGGGALSCGRGLLAG